MSVHRPETGVKASPNVVERLSNYFRSGQRRVNIPRRLSDDLRWRCSSCSNLVSTKETHFHLITCLMTLVNTNNFANNLLSKASDCQCSSPNEPIMSLAMDANKAKEGQPLARPRTKRLDRPTPNIKHPVIGQTESSVKLPTPNRISDGLTTPLSVSSLSSTPSPIFKYRTLAKIETVRPNPAQAPDVHVDSVIMPATRKNVLEKIEHDNVHLHDTPKVRGPLVLQTDSTRPKVSTSQSSGTTTRKKGAINTKDSKSAIKKGCDPAGWEHFKSQLVPCPKCGRTFYPHRLNAHQKTCNVHNATLFKSADMQKSTNRTERTTAKKIVKCERCDRAFTSMTIEVHMSSCVGSGEGKHDANEEDDEKWKTHLEQLKPCRKCKRKFFPDRLKVHEPNCKADPLT